MIARIFPYIPRSHQNYSEYHAAQGDLPNFSGYHAAMQKPPKKLLIRVREAIRLKHHSYRTEKTYVQWIRRYILFQNKRHPSEMEVPEIEAFLTYLATECQVATSTQNQAFNTILFLYRKVLRQELEGVLMQFEPSAQNDCLLC